MVWRERKPREGRGGNSGVVGQRGEEARTAWGRDGRPDREWEALLSGARRRADEAGHYR